MLKYNAPINGEKSSIDGADSDQMQTFLWLKKAIITQAKEQYFTPLADVTTMPKYFGKTMKLYEYVPLLDDRNINDQGIDANGATIKNGNLYGSSKDIGTIVDAMPTLTEEGGRRNRVGFTRLTRSGSLHKFGLFTEFTQEALDFDSDGADLMDHISNELTKGAVQFTEDKIQSDLLAAAGTVLYSGAAIGDAEITGEVTPKTDTTPEIPASIVTQDDLVKLDQILNDNDTPRQTTIITGTQKVDTVTLPSCRIMYVGSELVPLLKKMRNYFNEPLWVPVQKYAAGTTVLNGEVGSIGDFRVVSVPRMLSWKGKGAKVVNNTGYRSSMVNGEEHYDIYPMLVVGDDSFTTIGYQSDGKMIKMSVLTTMPNERGSYNDPYAETGRTALKWYYGILIKRPERIGLIKTVAPI